MVFLYGKNSDGIHQAHYGTEYYTFWGWTGCEWDELDGNPVRVCRGEGDENVPESKWWSQYRIIIIRVL